MVQEIVSVTQPHIILLSGMENVYIYDFRRVQVERDFSSILIRP